jgi:hypothetical protein
VGAARELLGSLDRCIRGGAWKLLLVLGGLVVGWWVYVPVHEILHAAACAATGGSVEVLEISTIHGGQLWSAILPFVVANDDYAGRLSGFDTGGSDLVYLATDLGPFVLTLLPGLWALRRAARRSAPFLFGFWLPFALAPFASLTGDAYEIGSILVTCAGPWSDEPARQLLRGDDLFVRIGRLREHAGPAPWIGLGLASLLGLLWAVAVYALAHLVACALGEPPLREID